MTEAPSAAKLSPPVDLPDLLLAKLFSYLPPKERFQVSAVCRQWCDAARIAWSDIKRLNLRDIPSAKINSILSLTPVVREVIASKQKIILDDDFMPPILPRLENIKLYDVCFVLHGSGLTDPMTLKYERLLNDYFERFPNVRELIWHNVTSIDSQGDPIFGKQHIGKQPDNHLAWFPTSPMLGQSLRCLQLSQGRGGIADAANVLAALRGMEALECLYLGGSLVATGGDDVAQSLHAQFYSVVERMSNLRELCLANLALFFNLPTDSYYPIDLSRLAAVACEKILKLEVLIIAASPAIKPPEIARLVTSHPTLKILVIAGQDTFMKNKFELQPHLPRHIISRRSLRSPVDHSSLPHLHIFVGGPILRCVRFTLPEPRAAVFTEIDCPMPQFLAKPEVAEVFKDVWIAKIICEGAGNGMQPWGSPHFQHVFYSNNTLQFHHGGN